MSDSECSCETGPKLNFRINDSFVRNNFYIYLASLLHYTVHLAFHFIMQSAFKMLGMVMKSEMDNYGAEIDSTAEYCASAWCRCHYTRHFDNAINSLRILTSCLQPTPSGNLSSRQGRNKAEAAGLQAQDYRKNRPSITTYCNCSKVSN